MFIQDLCRAADVSERTLRNIFQEYFGVGPMRLLKMRQLHEIRAALLTADPVHDTVASIAGRFGVWDFSLFARNYKALFGESPSETLRTRRRSEADAHDDLRGCVTWRASSRRSRCHATMAALPSAVGRAERSIGRITGSRA